MGLKVKEGVSIDNEDRQKQQYSLLLKITPFSKETIILMHAGQVTFIL